MRKFSEQLRSDIVTLLERAVSASSIVEVSPLAETVRERHNGVSLEDIEALIAQQAGLMSSAMLFDRESSRRPDILGRDMIRSGGAVQIALMDTGGPRRGGEHTAMLRQELERDDVMRSFADGKRARPGAILSGSMEDPEAS